MSVMLMCPASSSQYVSRRSPNVYSLCLFSMDLFSDCVFCFRRQRNKRESPGQPSSTARQGTYSVGSCSGICTVSTPN